MDLGDIKSKRLILWKGVLFLFTGAAAIALLLAETPSWRNAFLLAVIIWSFCRFYYFAFYVIERYVDPTFRYAGLISLIRYFIASRRRSNK